MKYFRLKAAAAAAATSQSGGGVSAAVPVSKITGALQFLALLLQNLFGLRRRTDNDGSALTTHDAAGETTRSGLPVPRVQVCPCVAVYYHLYVINRRPVNCAATRGDIDQFLQEKAAKKTINVKKTVQVKRI